MNFSPDNRYAAVFLFLLACVWLVFQAGGRPGYDPDGATALHLARNLAAGDGIVDYAVKLSDTRLEPRPTITKPPLYTAATAVFIKLGLPGDMAAWLVTASAWAAAVPLLFFIARLFLPFPHAFLVSLFPVFQASTLRWGINLHEESLFVAFSLAALWRVAIASQAKLQQKWPEYLFIGALAALAMLSSYQALPLILIILLFATWASYRFRSGQPVLACVAGMAITAVIPLLRFVHYWLAGVRPGFEPTQGTTYYKMLAGILSAFQNDILGRMVVWLYSGSAVHLAITLSLYLALAAYLVHLARAHRGLRWLAAYFVLYLVLIVIQWGGIGKANYEARYNVPLYGLFFLFLATGFHALASRFARQAVGIGVLALALVALILAQSPRYRTMSQTHGAMCPAAETMQWLQEHVPAGAVVASTQCGYQLVADLPRHYWLAIPPVMDLSSEERWNEADLLQACKFGVPVWVVLLDGKKKDPYLATPGYGPFVTGLYNGIPGAAIKLAARTGDGLIYRAQCEAAASRP